MSSADPLNFYLYNRKMRDELHNNQTNHIRNHPSRLLKKITAPFTDNEFSDSPPEDKVPCIPPRYQT